MNADELARYRAFEQQGLRIHATHLSRPEENRTLFYGYTPDMGENNPPRSVHVYLWDGTLFHVEYLYNEVPKIIATAWIDPARIKVKRGYPESCDYEFCVLLRRLGFNPSMTNLRPEDDDLRKQQNNGFAGKTA